MKASDAELRKVRGNDITMIFQEPMTSLNPLHAIERQIGEILELHQGLKGEAARKRVLELLHQVGIREPEKRLSAYPHELSGGQRQRVMIAMALANRPELLIADEPTTALDVTVQAQILTLLKALKDEHGMSMLFITHDLGIVRKIADRVCVMTKGKIVETGPTAEVFANPQHAYTKHLLASEPRGRPPASDPSRPTVIEAQDVKVWFPIRAGFLRRTVDHVKAVDGIDLTLRAGQTLGIVGESGSGKTTLGLALTRLIASRDGLPFSARILPASAMARCGRCAGACRSSSRIPTVRSAPACRSLTSSARVSACMSPAFPPASATSGWPRRSKRSASMLRPAGVIRTNSPAASGSASPLPAPWC